MTKKDGLFVKINYGNLKGINDKQKQENINKNRELKKFLYCAGVLNKNGGTMIFRADNIDEANYIVSNNPFVHCEAYKYEILNNNVIKLTM
ncbi:hypothetical protein IAI10_08800 [Clostridium sp. 19966]|uniref:hypothetical protein n=1 Tax=Clostridium sp. 19966 TaxID=2768166 RepID=UPI0028DE2FB8|nr:hypothetical protein [Clostridium sp. 19966]MDT8716755.1 hypothetical protein [Clostridium sp. 19966]